MLSRQSAQDLGSHGPAIIASRTTHFTFLEGLAIDAAGVEARFAACDPGRTEVVAADRCVHAGFEDPPLDDFQGRAPGHPSIGEPLRFAFRGPEQWLPFPLREAGRVDIGLGAVMGGHVVRLSVLLAKRKLPPFAGRAVVVDIDAKGDLDQGERAEADGNQCLVAKPDQVTVSDAVKEPLSSFRIEDGLSTWAETRAGA